MTEDKIDDLVRADLAGLQGVAKQYGPHSEEVQTYLQEARTHYTTDIDQKSWGAAVSTMMLVTGIGAQHPRERRKKDSSSLDDLLKVDLAGLVNVAKEYGPTSQEVRTYWQEASAHYTTDKDLKEWGTMAATTIQLMNRSEQDWENEGGSSKK